MELDGEHIPFQNVGQLITISPGCVHSGFGEGGIRYMCVMRPHKEFTDPPGDMCFEDLPEPLLSNARFGVHDLTTDSFDREDWPYTVEYRSLSAGAHRPARNDRAMIVLPDQSSCQITAGDLSAVEVEPGWLLAVRKGCSVRLKRSLNVCQFDLKPNWRELLERLAYTSS